MNPTFRTALLANPTRGAKILPLALDFSDTVLIETDLTQELLNQEMDFVQSVFIDNSLNPAVTTLIFGGVLTAGYNVTAQPFSQGWYPVCIPQGRFAFSARTSQGIIIDVQFANIAMPYFTWGPAPGILVVPALTNVALDVTPTIMGDNQLVAGVLGETVKLYRGIFSVDNPALLKFTDGPAGALLFAAQLTAGGSLTFQASGANWFAAGPGNDLTLNMSAAVNLYGGFGYVQS